MTYWIVIFIAYDPHNRYPNRNDARFIFQCDPND